MTKLYSIGSDTILRMDPQTSVDVVYKESGQMRVAYLWRTRLLSYVQDSVVFSDENSEIANTVDLRLLVPLAFASQHRSGEFSNGCPFVNSALLS